MTYNVWTIHPDGSAETIAADVDAERAEAIRDHPCSGVSVVLPSWADTPAADRDGVAR